MIFQDATLCSPVSSLRLHSTVHQLGCTLYVPKVLSMKAKYARLCYYICSNGKSSEGICQTCHNSYDLHHLTLLFYEARSFFSGLVIKRELVQWALNSMGAKISAAAMALLIAASVPYHGDPGDFGASNDEQLNFIMSGLLTPLVALCMSRLSILRLLWIPDDCTYWLLAG